MRIGLYGGMANNMYVFAKALAAAGADVAFLRDQGDRYAFSQPVWEDVRCTLSFGETAASAGWSLDAWRHFEQRHGWKPPDWLVDPLGECAPASPARQSDAQTIPQFLFDRPSRWQQAVVEHMRRCDALLVCGVEPTLLAARSEVPFVVWPHGGDLLMAAGLLKAPGASIGARIHHALLCRRMAAALERAEWIGTHDAQLLGGHVGDVSSRLSHLEVRHLPIPLQCLGRTVRDERRRQLAEHLGTLGLPMPDADFFLLVPSRVDFYWKGQDRLLEAFSRIAGKGRLHLLFSGWGNDYHRARSIVAARNLHSHVTFLTTTFSKPLLYELMAAADLVVDQFRYGTYGTAAVEAMSCGTPVMMFINDAAFHSRGWPPPPVLNVQTVDQIEMALSRIVAEEIDLDGAGRMQQEWIRRVHGGDAVVPGFMQQIAARLGHQGTAAA
ncbi:MAG: glycosyltransferase [Planctomycetes bacterium]|nr:glycosyltransferase [Planctomycetota bacterium]